MRLARCSVPVYKCHNNISLKAFSFFASNPVQQGELDFLGNLLSVNNILHMEYASPSSTGTQTLCQQTSNVLNNPKKTIPTTRITTFSTGHDQEEGSGYIRPALKKKAQTTKILNEDTALDLFLIVVVAVILLLLINYSNSFSFINNLYIFYIFMIICDK